MIPLDNLHSSVGQVEGELQRLSGVFQHVATAALYHSPSKSYLLVRDEHGWTLPSEKIKIGEEATAAFCRLAFDNLHLPEESITEVQGLPSGKRPPIFGDMENGFRRHYLPMIAVTGEVLTEDMRSLGLWLPGIEAIRYARQHPYPRERVVTAQILARASIAAKIR